MAGKEVLAPTLAEDVYKWDSFMHNVLGYNYLGPGTPGTAAYVQNVAPVNELDAMAMEHDLAYERLAFALQSGVVSAADVEKQVLAIDQEMVNKIWNRGVSWGGLTTAEMLSLVALQGKLLLDRFGIVPIEAYLGHSDTYRELVQNRLPNPKAMNSPIGELAVVNTPDTSEGSDPKKKRLITGKPARPKTTRQLTYSDKSLVGVPRPAKRMRTAGVSGSFMFPRARWRGYKKVFRPTKTICRDYVLRRRVPCHSKKTRRTRHVVSKARPRFKPRRARRRLVVGSK